MQAAGSCLAQTVRTLSTLLYFANITSETALKMPAPGPGM